MNKLTLTKKGFWAEWEHAKDPAMCDVLDSYPEQGEDDMWTHFYVVNILGNSAEQFSGDDIYLRFPERHIPFNMLGRFWNKVRELMSKGYSFEVVTSDPHAVAWIPGPDSKGLTRWNEAVFERWEDGEYIKTNLPPLFGWTYYSVTDAISY